MENYSILTNRTKFGDFSERWRPSPIHSIHWGEGGGGGVGGGGDWFKFKMSRILFSRRKGQRGRKKKWQRCLCFSSPLRTREYNEKRCFGFDVTREEKKILGVKCKVASSLFFSFFLSIRGFGGRRRWSKSAHFSTPILSPINGRNDKLTVRELSRWVATYFWELRGGGWGQTKD